MSANFNVTIRKKRCIKIEGAADTKQERYVIKRSIIFSGPK